MANTHPALAELQRLLAMHKSSSAICSSVFILYTTYPPLILDDFAKSPLLDSSLDRFNYVPVCTGLSFPMSRPQQVE